MNLKETLAARLVELKTTIDTAAAEDRDLTEAEAADVDAKAAEVQELKAKVERAEKQAALVDSLFALPADYVEDARTGEQIGGASGTKGRLALTGPAAKTAARAVARQMVTGHRGKSFLAPGTTELFALPVESGIVEQSRIPTSFLELLPVMRHDVPVWQYLEQTSFTNNAAIVAPGDEKPESELVIAKRDGKLSVIAHVTAPVDKYMLEDYDPLASFVSGQMLYGLSRKLEAYVLNGAVTDGITGIMNRSGVQLQAFDTDKVTTLRLAMTQLEVLGYEVGAILLNPLDWAAIETARAASGSFDLGGPIDRAQRKVWGVQVAASTGVPAGTGVALDTSAVRLDTDRGGVRVEWDRSVGFTRNEVIARVEGRFGLSVLHPDAVIKADLTEGA